MNRIVRVGCAGLLAVAFGSGCEEPGAIMPDLRASIVSAVDPERGPAPRAPEPESEATGPSPASASASASASALAPVAAVVTMGPGAACVTYSDGVTVCTGANSSTTRFGGLF